MKFILLFCLAIFSCKKPVVQVKKYVIYFIGDSMTSDDPGNISMTGITNSKSYGWYLKQSLNENYTFKNYAVSGVGVNEMRNQMQAIINDKDPLKINIVVILGCINNITFNEMSGEECYKQMSAIHATLHNSGFLTIGISLTSRRQLSYFSEAKCKYLWSQIIIADSLFKQNKFCDHYLDLQAVDGFKGYEAATESNYFLDGCHFSDVGKQKIASLLKLIL
jgi:lysophospholipase L1-like esterase